VVERSKPAYRFCKRMVDVSVATVVLGLTWPIILFACVLIYLQMGRPLFFKQVRPGIHGRPFLLFKLRTMTNAVDGAGRLLSDSERLNRLGKLLRLLSIDELPQLWNVILGDMSLVGPRPLLMEYVPKFSEYQRRRLLVPQGITGWAQVHGRNGITWEQKFDLDVWYVENRSMRIDLLILWLTLAKLIRPVGINKPGHATEERFVGNTKPL
jgi:sugar transferase EpsL